MARKFRALALLGIAFAVLVYIDVAIAQTGVSKIPAASPPALATGNRFEGSIQLSAIATDISHQIFAIHETIPIQASGLITLFYPEWETGSHAPTASVADLAGLIVHADGQRIEWQRDPIDSHAFHIDVLPGANTIGIDFQFLAPHSAALLRPDMIVVPWHRLLLYPAGWNIRDLPIATRLALPPGLHAFTALGVAGKEGDTLVFEPTTLAALIDAPVYAGRHWLQLELGSNEKAPVRLDVLADEAAKLAITPGEEEKLRMMITQADLVFGAGPYRHYDAILALSDVLSPGGGGGIEHLEEGENNLPSDYFVDNGHQLNNLDLIVHEYVHAWNGRYRQPADLWSPNLNQPEQGSLLWVYEGQTEFWGRVLAARAGLRTREETLDKLALDAALVANRAGRAWKSLADSNNDPLYMAGRPVAWRDWQRREDYYSERVLLWLDMDARLREKTDGQHGVDDFAQRFFATNGQVDTVSTYTFGDVCAALNAIVPDDWAAILRRHLESHDDADAMAGLERAGWRLVYDELPSETFRQDEAEEGVGNLDYSIGLRVRPDGTVRSVVWNGPAFSAGLSPGARIIEVNGQPFTIPVAENAVKNAKTSPLTLTFEVNGTRQNAAIDYHGSLRYPRLERIPSTVDRLTPLLTPRR